MNQVDFDPKKFGKDSHGNLIPKEVQDDKNDTTEQQRQSNDDLSGGPRTVK